MPYGYGFQSSTPDPELCEDHPGGAFPLPSFSNHPIPPTGISLCWDGAFDCEIAGPVVAGFPFNLNTIVGPTMGNFPPLSRDARRSSTPLIARDVLHIPGPVPYPERATLGGVVDLITGVPLLQEVDLELPFGSAVYRHVRTYAEVPSVAVHEHTCIDDYLRLDRAQAANFFWDWNGQGWMVGANPILLIDAAYSGFGDDPERRRSYFMPDAHHTIPFLRTDETNEWPTYEPVAGFDAILTYDKTGASWCSTEKKWNTPPSEWYIWLQRRSVKYTVKAYWEDVAYTNETPPVSYHEAPPVQVGGGPGMGVPYYGIVTKIEDRYGNRAEIEHCKFKAYGGQHENDCQECLQNCSEKGQIKGIKLYPAGAASNDPAWTLVYTHRAFQPHWHPNSGYLRHRQQAIHSIHVFKGDRDLGLLPDCLTIEHQVFVDAVESVWEEPPSSVTIDEIRAALAAVRSVNSFAVPALGFPSQWADEWLYEVKYLYTDATSLFVDVTISDPPPNGPSWIADLFGPGHHIEDMSPRLLLTTVRSRPESTSPGDADERHTLYRYAKRPAFRSNYDGLGLRAIYSPEALSAIRNGIEEGGGDADLLVNWPVRLLALGDNEEIVVPKEIEGDEDPDYEEVPFSAAASLRFDTWADDGRYGYADKYMESCFLREMAVDFIGPADPSKLIAIQSDVLVLEDLRGGSGGRFHKLYRFMQVPQSETPHGTEFTTVGNACGSSITMYSGGLGVPLYRGIFHHPHMYLGPGVNEVSSQKIVPPGHALWIVVIDEYDDSAGLEFDYTSELVVAQAPWGSSEPPAPVSRRVVQMNASGYVLKDKTWSIRTGEVLANHGLMESWEYDSNNRVVAHKTFSWDAADKDGQGSTKGLINVYDYDGDSTEVGAEGVKQGENGSTRWVRQYIRHPDRTELVTHEVSFLVPDAAKLDYQNPQPTAQQHAVTVTHYEFDQTGEPHEWKVERKTTVRPPATPAPGDPTRQAVTVEAYDEDGNMIARGTGLVANWATPGQSADDLFFVDTFEYYPWGPLEIGTVDADPTGHPSGLARNVPSGLSLPPLELQTKYRYAPPYLTLIEHPGGREEHFKHMINGGVREERRYNVWIPCGQQGAMWLAGGRARIYTNGQLTGEQLVEWSDPPGLPDGFESFVLMSEVTPGYDGAGRMNKLSLEDGDESVSASVAYDNLGQIMREKHPDGTITRNVHSPRGLLLAIYRGTKDKHEFWSNTEPGGQHNDDNMVLVEKRYYGDGTAQFWTGTKYHDTLLLNEVRRYRQKPNPIYPPAGTPNDEDELGWAEVYGYDWRGRQVWVTRFKEGSTPISDPGSTSVFPPGLNHTLTFFDHNDRICFIAIYDGAATPAVDPRTAASDAQVPTAVQLLATDVPVRLTETIYNERGLVEEVREYDTDDTAAETWLSTMTYYDHADRPIYLVSPGGGVQQFIYNAAGKTAETILAVPHPTSGELRQVSRRVSEFDDAGNEIITTLWERRHDASPNDVDPLDADNAIATYTYYWYDPMGLLLATAAVGTGGTEFVNVSPPARPTVNPVTWAQPGVFDKFEWNLGSVPPGVQITGYDYDGQARKRAVAHPNGAVTKYEYNRLDQVSMMLENAQAPQSEWRLTAYKYEGGRLVKMAAILQPEVDPIWFESPYFQQVTHFIYGAEVVNVDHTSFPEANYHGGLIGEVRFPDAETGLPSEDHTLTFKYTIDGLVAERTDARGVFFRHTYDEQSNRRLTTVDYSAVSLSHLTHPEALIAAIGYEYDPVTGQFLEAHATNSSTDTIAHNVYQYDHRGNLTHEYQQHGDEVNTSTSPAVEYEWDYSDADGGWNFDRLKSITYPVRPATSTRREVQFGYGDGLGSIDSGLSRITQIADQWRDLARYGYVGSSRRVETKLGFDELSGYSVVAQTFAGTSGYEGLDLHGRIKDLHWKSGGATPATLVRDQYGYDDSGNRTFARTERAGETANTRSWLYGYDALDRLVGAELGELNSGNTAIEPTTHLREAAWTLDSLGNWSGRESPWTPGLSVDGTDITHLVNKRNEIVEVETDTGGGPVLTPVIYDRNGNMVSDGDRFHQYDAWGRLVQVSGLGTLEFDEDGEVESGNPGAWIATFVYDGLGRLVQTIVPLSAWDDRIEDYYYDGVRRIQETATEPPAASFGQMSTVTWADREYVHSPGYVDEYVAQFDTLGTGGGRVAYVIQDANYNVLALANESADLMARYVWDPYGQLLYANLYGGQQFRNRIGHQGLFFDRLDAAATADPLVVGGVGLYQNRNRTYNPVLGRFMQRDPNGSGVPVLGSLATSGTAIELGSTGLDADAMYGDGMSLHAYVRANPLNALDPTGLEQWDPFDVVDEVSFVHQLSGAIAMGKINSFFNDKEVLRKIRAYEAGGFAFGEIIADRDIGILTSMILGPFLSKICFVEGTLIATPDGAEAIETLPLGHEIVSRHDPELDDQAPFSMAEDEPHVLIRLRLRRADGAITLIDILRSAELIAKLGINPGGRLPMDLPGGTVTGVAEVISIEPFEQPIRPDRAVVTGRFVTRNAEVVDLILSGVEDPIGVTPNHPFFSADRRSWVAASDLMRGERLKTINGEAVLLEIVEREGRYTVYNIEVGQYHTYFVGEASVWVHNECFPVSKPGGRRVSIDDQKSWIYTTVRSMQAAMKGSSTTNPSKVIRDFIKTTIQEASTLNKGAITKETFERLMKYLNSLLQ